MATSETVHEERGESQEERTKRLDEESAGLRSQRPDALRSQIMTLLASGQYLDTGREQECARDGLLRYAAAVTKAVAVASAGAECLSCNSSADVTFTEEDTANALLGLSALLEIGPELLHRVEYADHRSAKRDGGAS